MRFQKLLVEVYLSILFSFSCFRRAFRIPIPNLRNEFLAGLMLLSVFALPSAASAQVTIDLYQCVDSTGSLSEAQYANQVNGLSAALPTVFDAQALSDANIRFTMIRLRGPNPGQSDIIFPPRVMDSADDVTDAQNALTGTLPRQNANGTCVLGGNRFQDCCMDIAQSLFSGVPGDPLRILDITTDGLPNQGITNGNTINTAAMNFGFDSVNAVAIDNGNGGLQFLQNVTNDIGFVIPINVNSSVESYEDAFAMKIQSEITTGCCLADNMCSEGTESECIGEGGEFEPDTTCAQGCTPEPEGCCLVGDICTDDFVQSSCEKLGGTFGEGTDCGLGQCVAPTGCCDMIDGNDSCQDGDGITQTACNNLNGNFSVGNMCNFQGTCGDPVIVEGCCDLSDDSCSDLNNQECFNSGGTFTPDAMCNFQGNCGEPDIENGCCALTENTCADQTNEECFNNNGQFTSNVMCNFQGTCGPPVIVDGCCELSEGGCSDINNEQCFNAGGQFSPNNMCNFQGTCGDPVIVDGCCQFDGSCSEETNEECFNNGGTFSEALMCNFQGTCGDPIIVDGCCELPEGGCSDETNEECFNNRGTFSEAEMCNFQGTCGDPVIVDGCCQFDGSCNEETNEECFNNGGTFSEALMCNFQGNCGTPVIEQGCCQFDGSCNDETNESCFNNGGTFSLGEMCNFQGTCGDPIIETGCCMIDDVCENTTNEECFDSGGEFTPILSCNIEGECAPPPPTGCCVCGFELCNITSETLCEEMGESCEYQGDGSSCDGIDECYDEPGCCFLSPEQEAAIASRQVDPNKCVEVSFGECGELSGVFQGIGTSCMDFPAECFFPPRNVPTLSQWGLIATAGLLGMFSLLVIMRRQKYNMS